MWSRRLMGRRKAQSTMESTLSNLLSRLTTRQLLSTLNRLCRSWSRYRIKRLLNSSWHFSVNICSAFKDWNSLWSWWLLAFCIAGDTGHGCFIKIVLRPFFFIWCDWKIRRRKFAGTVLYTWAGLFKARLSQPRISENFYIIFVTFWRGVLLILFVHLSWIWIM